MIKKFFFIFMMVISLSKNIFSSVATSPSPEIKFTKSFGFCPTKMGGDLAQSLFEEFKRSHSLKVLKEKIIREEIEKKNFLSSYKIEYNPVFEHLTIKIDCPRPLLKIRILTTDSQEKENGILVENGKIFDPTYEIFLKKENRIHKGIPEFTVQDEAFDTQRSQDLTAFISSMPPFLYENLSEVYFDKNQNLNLILSISEDPVIIFMGYDSWSLKLTKLEKLIRYFISQEKIPSIVNLSNHKKIVVKFSGKL